MWAGTVGSASGTRIFAFLMMEVMIRALTGILPGSRMNLPPARGMLLLSGEPSASMDILLIFSVLILIFIVLSLFLVAKRMQAAPGTPLGRGMGLALGLAMGLALWLPLGYATGNESTGIILGSIIGIGTGVGLELWSRKKEKAASGTP